MTIYESFLILKEVWFLVRQGLGFGCELVVCADCAYMWYVEDDSSVSFYSLYFDFQAF